MEQFRYENGREEKGEMETWDDNRNISRHENLSEHENSSTAPLSLPLDMQFNESHKMAIVMYTSLMVVSALGNSYVFLSIIRLRKYGKLSRVTLLLLHLAVADLLVTFILMPLEIIWNATVSWMAGDLACRILSFFRTFGLYLSGFVVICMCMDRYFAVMTPIAAVKGQTRGRKLLIGAWVASVVCSLPQSFIFHVERHPQFPWYQQCVTFNAFPSPHYELAYNMFGFVFMYALPMLAISVCYSSILCKIHGITETKTTVSQLRRSSVVVIKRAQTKTLKMTVITVAAFTICWTPYNIISLWYFFDPSTAKELDPRIQKILFAFACTNSCVNPLIYGWYHVSRRHLGKKNLTVSRPQFQRIDISADRLLSSSLSPLPLSRQLSSRLASPMRDVRWLNVVENPQSSSRHGSTEHSWYCETQEMITTQSGKTGMKKMVSFTVLTSKLAITSGQEISHKVSLSVTEQYGAARFINCKDRRRSGSDLIGWKCRYREDDRVSTTSV